MFSTDPAVYEMQVTALRSAIILDDCATLSDVLNNRRITALTLTVATAAAALSVPSAGATTVGEPQDGVCTFTMNAAEKDFASSLPRTLSPDPVQDTQHWIDAFEVAFPQAEPISQEFVDLFQGSYVSVFNNDLENNFDRWAQRYVDAGIDEPAARWYFVQLWNSKALSDHTGMDIAAFWSDVDTAMTHGEISGLTGQEPYRKIELTQDAKLTEAQAQMSVAQRDKWVAAYKASPGVIDAGRVAKFRDAFIDARDTCTNGGGVVLLPTDGANPDAPTAPTTTPTAAPPQNGELKTQYNKVSISVSQTVNKSAPANQSNSGSSTGAIVGIVIALLVILGGGAAAAFAMGG